MDKFSLERALSLESKFDDSLKTRPISVWLSKFVVGFSVVFALYHYITAGIGVPVDFWHMGAHMSGVLILIFISFPAVKRKMGIILIPKMPAYYQVYPFMTGYSLLLGSHLLFT